MESKDLLSQDIVGSETINEAQTQTYDQPSTKSEKQEEENANLLPAICFLEQNFQFRHNVLSGIVEYKKKWRERHSISATYQCRSQHLNN